MPLQHRSPFNTAECIVSPSTHSTSPEPSGTVSEWRRTPSAQLPSARTPFDAAAIHMSASNSTPPAMGGTIEQWRILHQARHEAAQFDKRTKLAIFLVAAIIVGIFAGFVADLYTTPAEAAGNLYSRLLPIVASGLTWLFSKEGKNDSGRKKEDPV